METKKAKKGISLILANRILLVLASILVFITIAELIMNSTRYSNMWESTARFARYFGAAAEMNESSDYLTAEARKFINLKDKKYLDNYFNEIYNVKRREAAVGLLEGELADNESVTFIKEADKISDKLSEIEIYAMRLLVDGMKYDLEEYPEEIRNVEVKQTDEEKQPFSKIAYAWDLVTDDRYETYKADIRENVASCEKALYEEASTTQISLGGKMMTSVRWQEVLIILLLAISVVSALLSDFLLVRPLRRSQTLINNGEKMAIKGSREMRFFANAYNRIFERNVRKSEKLSYAATHDALTGLLNRAAFDKDIEEEDWEHAALLIVDIDGFKTINDTYLHSTGDSVLKAVANLINSAFRSEDRIYRIGGDEFAIIMIGANSSHEKLIRQKYEEVREGVKKNAENFYGATLSVGVAYGNFEFYSKQIFESADAALYEVKKNGKNNISFSPETWEHSDNS